ncbi:hypothetical protein DL771_002889 [Monosporascus sp. 5C6A]|nr:hypothetical protein DL771_002889 [Monosporascus sp. 5C6A]
MLASQLFVLAATVLPAFAQTITSTQTLTAVVTVSKCNPTNTDCPLYTPTASSTSSISSSTSSSITTTSSSSSSIPSTSSSSISSSNSSSSISSSSSASPTFYPTLNSTTFAGSTSYANTTTFSYTTKAPITTPTEIYPTTSSYPTSSSTPEEPPTSGAGLAFRQSGLLMGVLGLGVALLACFAMSGCWEEQIMDLASSSRITPEGFSRLLRDLLLAVVRGDTRDYMEWAILARKMGYPNHVTPTQGEGRAEQSCEKT